MSARCWLNRIIQEYRPIILSQESILFLKVFVEMKPTFYGTQSFILNGRVVSIKSGSAILIRA